MLYLMGSQTQMSIVTMLVTCINWVNFRKIESGGKDTLYIKKTTEFIKNDHCSS